MRSVKRVHQSDGGRRGGRERKEVDAVTVRVESRELQTLIGFTQSGPGPGPGPDLGPVTAVRTSNEFNIRNRRECGFYRRTAKGSRRRRTGKRSEWNFQIINRETHVLLLRIIRFILSRSTFFSVDVGFIYAHPIYNLI